MNILKHISNDLKKSWRVIQNIIDKEDKYTPKNNPYYLINNHYTIQKKTIANNCNNYFINVGISLAKKYKHRRHPLIYVQYYDKSIDIPEVNTDEIISIISSMTNSAAGYDEIPSAIMIQLIAYFVYPLTFLINKSIFQGTFPDELKLATVLPIYKDDNE